MRTSTMISGWDRWWFPSNDSTFATWSMFEMSFELIHWAESQAGQQVNWRFLRQFFCFSQAATHSQEFLAMQALVPKELQEVDQCCSGVPIQSKKFIAQHPCKGHPTTKAKIKDFVLEHQHLLHLCWVHYLYSSIFNHLLLTWSSSDIALLIAHW